MQVHCFHSTWTLWVTFLQNSKDKSHHLAPQLTRVTSTVLLKKKMEQHWGKMARARRGVKGVGGWWANTFPTLVWTLTMLQYQLCVYSVTLGSWSDFRTIWAQWIKKMCCVSILIWLCQCNIHMIYSQCPQYNHSVYTAGTLTFHNLFRHKL